MYTYKGAKYSLEINDHRVNVMIDGCPVATLDIATGIDSLDENYETVHDADKTLPVFQYEKADGQTKTFKWTAQSNLWEEKS